MTKIIKLVEEKKICSLPWVHTELSLQHDSIKPCCKYTNTFGKVSDGFTKVWFNDVAKEMRTRMSQNEYTSHCNACSASDDAFTYKNWKNSLYKDYFSLLDNVELENADLPKVFHFSLSNTCNLACRMCNPAQSSKLADITRKNAALQQFLYLPPHKKKINIENLRGSFTNVELITFAGGEPTIDDDCLEVIKMIKAESKNLRFINFSTNMMSLNHELLQILNEMNVRVNLSISIDGPPKIHEYIRYTGNWDLMINNLKIVKNTYPNITFAVNSTISVLNVGYAVELLKTIDEVGKNANIYWHSFMTSPVVDKEFLHPGLLPEEIKKEYLNRIQADFINIGIKNSDKFLPTAIEMLNTKVNSPFAKFLGYITEFDKIARTNFFETYPEFSAYNDVVLKNL